ncbi:MAG: Uma2 family endonuclease [Chloroherpetonaceae bacterium]|nr:Uma2 family endonuclease [Chloroherpetonaceae bacterium]MDW8438265.1 Uma2 family endonuclease [Chloroherpetonaceae bacterium]
MPSLKSPSASETAVAKMTPAEYLEFERNSEEKHEYINGEVIAAAGGTRTRNWLAMKISARLFDFLERNKSDCVVYNGDQKILVEATGNYYYPDCSIICGDKPFVEEDVATDALVIIEALSDSTEEKTRSIKFEEYQLLPSLREYALVSQKKPLVEIFRKETKNEWRYVRYDESNPTIRIESVGFEMSINDLYDFLKTKRQ